MRWYSGSAKGEIQRNYLHRQVVLSKPCVILELAASGDETFQSLYDAEGKPTKYAEADQWWLIRLFTKPDYRAGGLDFLDVSRYHGRKYGLSDRVDGQFTRQWPINEPDPKKRLTFGPLNVYRLESGTSVYVSRFHSVWYSDSLTTMEYLEVVVRVTLPGTGKQVDAACSVEVFERMMRAKK